MLSAHRQMPSQTLAELMLVATPSSREGPRVSSSALNSRRSLVPTMKRGMGHDSQEHQNMKPRRWWWLGRRRNKEEKQHEQNRRDNLLKEEGLFIDAKVKQFGERLNAGLAASLETFRDEVLSEVIVQQDQARDKLERLKKRQSAIWDSLTDLGQEVLDDIEDGLDGFKRSTETFDRATRRTLRDMRATWEAEVNELITGAQEEIDAVVEDLEGSINVQRDDWQRNVESFEKRFLLPFEQSNVSRTANQTPAFALTDARLAELQSTINAISEEVERDLNVFKNRLETTSQRLEVLPSEITKLKSLVALRMYVADTIFAGDVPELLTKRAESYQRLFKDGALPHQSHAVSSGISPPEKPHKRDPLGLRRAMSARTNPVLRPTPASNLRLPGRHILIITTAAMPWMTGTSINPLLRAAYLSKAGYNVTLMVPWLDLDDQAILFPGNLTFERPDLQEQYIRWWCENRASVKASNLRIRWYPAEYTPGHSSVFPLDDDVTSLIPESERDVAILEEPEHLTWYHHGPRWIDQFNHVVGVGHTNYLSYARNEKTVGLIKSGAVKEKFVGAMNNLVCAAHTDLIIRLSATLPKMTDNDLVCNVHGVRAEFLAIGKAVKPWERDLGVYFLGKALYTKGYRELIDAMELHRTDSSTSRVEANPFKRDSGLPHIDTYGSGPELEAIASEIREKNLPIQTNPGIDHAHPSIHRYNVFVNPSTSDVLCTATAEALAMGKRVIIPDHPSNTFFKQFNNTMMYQDPREVVPLIYKALEMPPAPLSNIETYMLSWEAASERLLDAAALPAGTFNRRTSKGPAAQTAYLMHNGMSTQPVYDVFRAATGRGAKVPIKERIRGMPMGQRVINSAERMTELKLRSKLRPLWRRDEQHVPEKVKT